MPLNSSARAEGSGTLVVCPWLCVEKFPTSPAPGVVSAGSTTASRKVTPMSGGGGTQAAPMPPGVEKIEAARADGENVNRKAASGV